MSSRLMLVLFVVLPIGLLHAAPAPKPTQEARPKPKDGPLGMKFVFLPKGTFYMGWNGEVGSAIKTEIKQDFEMATHTVTQGQWESLMGNNPSWFCRTGEGSEKVKDISDEDLKSFPVESVSWDHCQLFLSKLNEKEKGKGWLYALPSEAEWEYACRGGATSEAECSFHFYFDKPTHEISSRDANIARSLDRPAKVGSYPPNRSGLHDMHGNVFQWCAELKRPHANKGRAIRGSYWLSDATHCTPVIRQGADPTDAFEHTGLRLVRYRVATKGE